jgi:hypothetical protein
MLITLGYMSIYEFEQAARRPQVTLDELSCSGGRVGIGWCHRSSEYDELGRLGRRVSPSSIETVRVEHCF